MPRLPKEVPFDQLPLGRCYCTWWRVATKDYGKAVCAGCKGVIRRLDAVDRLVYDGRVRDVRLDHFEQAKRDWQRWANE